MSATVTPTSDLSSYLGPTPDVQRVYDNVMAALPGVTLSTVKLSLWNAIEQFCIESTYARKRVTWTMGIGVSQVDFNPVDADTVACWVLQVSGLYAWHVDPPASLVDERQPSQARTGEAILVLKPSQFDENSAWSMAPLLFTNWFETILSGTLCKLYEMPAKPWSAVPLANYHESKFRAGIKRARDVADRQNAAQPSAFQFPYFAAGRRKR